MDRKNDFFCFSLKFAISQTTREKQTMTYWTSNTFETSFVLYYFFFFPKYITVVWVFLFFFFGSEEEAEFCSKEMKMVESYSYLGPYSIFGLRKFKFSVTTCYCRSLQWALADLRQTQRTQILANTRTHSYLYVCYENKTISIKTKQLVNHQETLNLGCPQKL